MTGKYNYIKEEWNRISNEHNLWDNLKEEEKVEFAFALAAKECFQNIFEYREDSKQEPYFQEYDVSCTKCGLQLDKVCGYVCTDLECPSGLRPARS